MFKFLLTWHRRLKWPVFLFLFLWLASGISHPIMSMMKLRPPRKAVPILEASSLTGASSLSAILAKTKSVVEVRVVNFAKSSYYQLIFADSSVKYYDVKTGLEISNGDQVYAQHLAHYYLQGPAKADQSFPLITEYSHEYPRVNKLLPVRRIDLEDGRSVYLHTQSSQLALVSNKTQYVFAAFFGLAHTFSFLDGVEYLRVIILTLALLAIGFMIVSGIYLFFKKARSVRKGLASWHATGGLILSLPLLLLFFSGVFHLLLKSPKVSEPLTRNSLPELVMKDDRALGFATELSANAELSGLSFIAGSSGESLVRTHDEIFDLAKEDTLNSEDFVKMLIPRIVGQVPIKEMRLQNHFSAEYGFVNRLLPVWRIEAGENLYFVDAQSRQLSLKLRSIDYAEGWSFSMLHKWHFLDKLIPGKGFKAKMKARMLRNGIVIGVCLFSLILCFTGLIVGKTGKLK